MKVPYTLVLFSCVVLTACSKKAPEPPAVAAPAPAALASKPLTALFDEVDRCLTACSSIWWRLGPDALYERSQYGPMLPLAFTEMLQQPGLQEGFDQLVAQLPNAVRDMVQIRPDELQAAEVKSSFGSYTTEPPKMHGSLANIVEANGRTIYLYTGVSLFRLKEGSPGAMVVAIDLQSKEFAAVAQSSRDESYRLAGADGLRSTLLAYTIAADIDAARRRVHRMTPNAGPYEAMPPNFPIEQNLDDYRSRVRVLNDRLGEGMEAVHVPPPSFVVAAEAQRLENSWFAIAQGRGHCVESPVSPDQRIGVVREAGVIPRVSETTTNGKITEVRVVASDGGYEQSWRFFKSKAVCEQTLGQK